MTEEKASAHATFTASARDMAEDMFGGKGKRVVVAGVMLAGIEVALVAAGGKAGGGEATVADAVVVGAASFFVSDFAVCFTGLAVDV